MSEVESKDIAKATFQIGKSTVLDKGITAIAMFRNDLPHGAVDSVADHETCHIILAARDGILAEEGATIVATSEYLGATFVTDQDDVVAMGPHSQGANGTGADLFSVKGSIGAASAEASRRLANESHTRQVIGAALTQEKSLSGRRIHELIHLADQQQEGTGSAVVFLTDQSGNKQEIQAKAEHNVVSVAMEEGQWYSPTS